MFSLAETLNDKKSVIDVFSPLELVGITRKRTLDKCVEHSRHRLVIDRLDSGLEPGTLFAPCGIRVAQ